MDPFCNLYSPKYPGFWAYSPPEVDRIWGIWGSYYNIPKAIFFEGDSRVLPCIILSIQGLGLRVLHSLLTTRKSAVGVCG